MHLLRIMFLQTLSDEIKTSVPNTPLTRNGAGRDGRLSQSEERVSNDTRLSASQKFQSAYGACNFIVTWNGEDVRELLAAIQYARLSGDRFIQDKLIEYILNIPFRHPRPSDIPAFVGKPIWAVDKQGRVLIGMPGVEMIVEASLLREQLKAKNGQLKPHVN